MAKRVNGETFRTEVLEAAEPVLVEFYSDGCLGCKQISPVLGECEDEYEEQIKIVKVNAAFSEDLKEQYKIEVYPTILFFHNGEETNRFTGVVEKEILEETIQSFSK